MLIYFFIYPSVMPSIYTKLTLNMVYCINRLLLCIFHLSFVAALYCLMESLNIMKAFFLEG